MSSDPILERLQALLEEARREAYERGYADAVQRIVAAASATAGVEAPILAPAPAPAAPPVPRAPRAAPLDDDGAPRQRARRGTLETRLIEILATEDAEGYGLTIAQIEEATSADAEPLKLPSIRATLQRMLGAGRVVREGRRWSLAEGVAPPAALVADDDEDDSTAADGDDEASPLVTEDEAATAEAGLPDMAEEAEGIASASAAEGDPSGQDHDRPGTGL